MRFFARPVLALIAVAVVLGVVPAPGLAAPPAPYSKQAFVDAPGAGRPIVVFVHAPWCITCRRQQPIVDKLARDPALEGVLVLVVDYDKDKATLRELNIADRSTLVAFRGKDERKRVSFVTDEASLRAVFQSAL